MGYGSGAQRAALGGREVALLMLIAKLPVGFPCIQRTHLDPVGVPLTGGGGGRDTVTQGSLI